jgi:hypothetical protein
VASSRILRAGLCVLLVRSYLLWLVVVGPGKCCVARWMLLQEQQQVWCWAQHDGVAVSGSVVLDSVLCERVGIAAARAAYH